MHVRIRFSGIRIGGVKHLRISQNFVEFGIKIAIVYTRRCKAKGNAKVSIKPIGEK